MSKCRKQRRRAEKQRAFRRMTTSHKKPILLLHPNGFFGKHSVNLRRAQRPLFIAPDMNWFLNPDGLILSVAMTQGKMRRSSPYLARWVS